MIIKTLKNILTSWSYWLGLCSGILFITLNVTGKRFTHFPGDLGDARFNIYLLEHAHKFITGDAESLWNAPFMYPESNVITYSENLAGTAPFYSVFRILGFARETSFQWWFLLITGLNYAFCYLFLKNLLGNQYAALLGAFVFAFSLSLQSQMTHAQTFTRFPIPLTFWMIFLFSKGLNPKYYFAALLFLAYQLYCGIYLGLLLLIPFSLMILFSLLFCSSALKKNLEDFRWWLKITAASLIVLLISLPLIVPYVHRANQLGLYQYENIINTVPTFKSFFFSQQGSFFWDFLSDIAKEHQAWWDHQIFAGAIATICLIFFVVVFISKIIKKNSFRQFQLNPYLVAIFLTFLLTFFFFTRIEKFSCYWLIFKLPGFGALRSLTRIINIELIFFSVATGFVFNILFRKNKWLNICFFIVLLGLIMVDNYLKEGYSYRTEKSMAQARINDLTEKMEKIPEGTVVSYEPVIMETYSIFYQLDAMLASQKLNLIAINGYTNTSPPGYNNYWYNMSDDAREEWLRMFNFSADTIIVIH